MIKHGDIERIIRENRRATSLILRGRSLTFIPDSIAMLRDLRYLNLAENDLVSLSPSLLSLPDLQELSLSRNPNLILPDWLGKLKSLISLHLAGLNLTILPTFVRSLRKLRELYLGDNAVETLPDWLVELQELRVLRLDNNRLRTLPKSLTILHFLDMLSVHNNPALNIPPEIAASRKAPQILDYYWRVTTAPARPLNEYKLILVGRGGVGKTSLVHRLLTDQYKAFSRTPGINITKWPNTIDGDEVRAHIWDFGGQEIMHGTHRFFMTERALYLVLVSGREGTEDHDAEYWLSMVRSFAGDVPVIVLLHKSGEYSFELNRGLLRDKYGKDLVFLETDSQTGDNIAALRDKICALAKKLPGLKAAWPGEWRRIKEELPASKANWITFDDFRAYCAERGIDKAHDQEALADSLHDLGLMLSYRSDESLRHFGVLNPQWVTTGIYQMLNAPSLKEDGGKFSLKSFSEILSAKDYPERLHPYLLALMRKFQLCHPLDEKGTKYLIPELLTKEEPKLEHDFPPDECLNFIYHYDAVLPEGLLPRFIVETYVHHEPRLAWRTGVVLERDNCRALVRGDVQGRRVYVRVTGDGNGRRALLGIVREHFERIHRSYENLPVTELVPIPGYPQATVKHDLLLKYERDRREEIAVEIGDHLMDFEVKALLDGVDLPGKRRARGYRTMPAFISYARKDAQLFDQLKGALVPHERMGKLRIWADQLTEPGEKWEEQIVAHLDEAELVILLLTPDFLNSSYCMDVELPRTMERQQRGECTIAPILARPCGFKSLPIGELQVIMPDGKAVTEHRNRDRAWLTVTEELDRVIDRR